MHIALGWLLILGPLHPTAAPITAQSLEIGRRQQTDVRISVWADREQPYRRGDAVRVYFRAQESGHLTILRVDTDGRIRTLFPREPWLRTYVRGGRTLEVADSREQTAFTIDDGPGVGYLFAITSPLPFRYEDVTRADHWDFRLIDGGRLRRDPYVALTDLARRIAPRGNFRYDIAPYYVERHYEYPRFVCYDCHTYAGYDEWDPYATSCARYRVVIYDDPAYYPYRYNRGQSVVANRPRRPAPRYVFKDAAPGVDYVTRQRQRESHELRRSGGDRGRTSADVGGPGVIPAPGISPGEPAANGRPVERGPVMRRDLAAPPRSPSAGDGRRVEGRKRNDNSEPEGLRPVEREPRKVPPVQRGARNPQRTGEPELRRRKP
jgi:hypothetical protein